MKCSVQSKAWETEPSARLRKLIWPPLPFASCLEPKWFPGGMLPIIVKAQWLYLQSRFKDQCRRKVSVIIYFIYTFVLKRKYNKYRSYSWLLRITWSACFYKNLILKNYHGSRETRQKFPSEVSLIIQAPINQYRQFYLPTCFNDRRLFGG